MKKIVLLILCVLVLFMYKNTSKEQNILIPESAIRFRILANSNSVYDQVLKERIKDKLQYELFNTLKDAKSVDEAKNTIKNNIPELSKVLDNEMEKEHYSYTIDYGMHYFPKKEYKGVEYSEGEYESLLVTLGKGEGDNYWCVLFPPLCVMEVEESDANIEYKFFIKDLLEKYF